MDLMVVDLVKISVLAEYSYTTSGHRLDVHLEAVCEDAGEPVEKWCGGSRIAGMHDGHWGKGSRRSGRESS